MFQLEITVNYPQNKEDHTSQGPFSIVGVGSLIEAMLTEETEATSFVVVIVKVPESV